MFRIGVLITTSQARKFWHSESHDMTNNTKFDLTTAHILVNKFSCFFKVQAVVFSLKQTTNTGVFSRVLSCATMSMTDEVHIVYYCKYIQLLKKAPLFKETGFIFFSRYKVFTCNNIFAIFLLRRTTPHSKQWRPNIPNQLMTKVKEIWWFPYQERIALEILIVQWKNTWPLGFGDLEKFGWWL